MKIEVTQKDPLGYAHVEIDGVHVGTGRREECEALVEELKADRSGKKARLLYSFFKERENRS